MTTDNAERIIKRRSPRRPTLAQKVAVALSAGLTIKAIAPDGTVILAGDDRAAANGDGAAARPQDQIVL